MPGTKKNMPPCPAQWVGGQRRKLIRRNRSSTGPPRSSTMPVLNPGLAAASLVSSASSAGSGNLKDRPSEDSFDRHMHDTLQELEDPADKMQFYPPSGAVKSNAAPYTALTDSLAASSSKLTVPDHKKKQGLFSSKKSKSTTLDRPKTSPSTSLVTSPLPVSTPTKAAKFFGLETKPSVAESPHRAQHQDDVSSDDGAPVRPALKKQYSLPLLTRFKIRSDRRVESKEEDVELNKLPEAPKSDATKALRMLIPEFAAPRQSPIEQTKTPAVRFGLDDEDEDVGYSSDSQQYVRCRISAAPRPVRNPSKSKAIRRKPLKDFPRMSPITEASVESLRPVYREGEDVTELGVISEYEYEDPPHSAPVQPRSHIETTLPPNEHFALDEADLSPTDDFYDEEETDEEESVVHPGIKVNIKRVHWQQAIDTQFRSPLQAAEDAWLDATEEEMRLEARRMTLARVEAEKQSMDDEIAELRRKHEELKVKFETTKSNPQPDTEPHEGSEEDDADLSSQCSSIDLGDGPILHETQAITFTRVKPGMVKLVDIPLRSKKLAVTSRDRVTMAAQCLPVALHEKTVTAAGTENLAPLSPVNTSYHHGDLDCSTKPKKSKLPRDESRLLVQNWISDYNSTEQRPVSTRIDPDVLADQETPPAPFPKSDESLPTPPIKARSDSLNQQQHLFKHHCINNGHIFHPVDLKTMPDNAVVNSLEVRPYLQTHTGIKQHVKIAVLCEKCGEDCDENVWECEIAICRMAVCQSCAEDMEAEWQQRAVNGWKYK